MAGSSIPAQPTPFVPYTPTGLKKESLPNIACAPNDGFKPDPDDGKLWVSSKTFMALAQAMPKTELHTHIEGAVLPETILDLANQYQVELPAKTVDELKDKIGMKEGEDLLAFLKKFECFRFVFDQPETLKRLAYEQIAENKRENINYTELRINPYKRTDKVSVGGVLDAVLDGMDQAKKDLGVDAVMIASINRSYDVAKAMEVAKAAVERKERGVVGLDLAGDEVHNAPEKFEKVFDYARANGLHVTVHAGEAVGPTSIQGAVNSLGAERIGHGVRAQEDPATVKMLEDKGITLELCPTSNYLLNVVTDLSKYPLANYYHDGMKVTISTDDRAILDTNLSHEYTVLAQKTGLTLGELEQISLQGIDSSFQPAGEKDRLQTKFQADMLAYNANLPRLLATIEGALTT